LLKAYYVVWAVLLVSALTLLFISLASRQVWLLHIAVWTLIVVAVIQVAVRIPLRIATMIIAARSPGPLLPNANTAGYADTSPDEPKIRDALRRLKERCGGACPQWVESGVDEVLALPPGPDLEKRRAELLQRLYGQAGFSSDDFETRRAYNELRLAINPNVPE
jgi:hypothetical protein